MEAVGLPMTILSAVYSEAPKERIPQELYDYFSAEFADRDTFRSVYGFGDFNSVKWGFEFSEEKMQKLKPSELFSMTWKAVRANGQLSLLAAVELTDMVYSPLENDGFVSSAYVKPGCEAQIILWPQSEELHQFFDTAVKPAADSLLNHPLVHVLSSNYGFLTIVMLLAWYVSCKNIHGWRSLWLILPVLAYNWGTMLLLCGNDGRFFHFNCFAAYPIAMLLLTVPQPCSEPETQHSAQ